VDCRGFLLQKEEQSNDMKVENLLEKMICEQIAIPLIREYLAIVQYIVCPQV
jgi:hypothetical protein